MPRSDFQDLTGKRFGRLIAIKVVGQYPDGRYKWLAKCDCGNEVTARSDTLKGMKSCGCIRREKNVARFYKHGDSRTALYKIHTRLMQATSNPNYWAWKNYGGKGVRLAEEWKDWETFKSWALSQGYERGKQIHRIDSDGDYSPENCVWLTTHEHQKLHGAIHKKPAIEKLDDSGKVIETVSSWAEVESAGHETGGIRRSIRQGCRSAGFYWRRTKLER